MTPPSVSLPNDLSARIDLVIDQALRGQRLVGAVVLVAQDGRLRHQRAAGLADREAGRPMSADTLFRLASVSKPIVSTAAMVLVAQQRLALDAPVTRWLPDFQPRLADGAAARITPRQLLSHTAGLGYRFLEADSDGPYARAGISDGMDRSGITLAENLRRLAGVPLSYVPGSGWGYSLATDVLGALIERICNMPLAQAVRTLVTAPLGMDDTDFHAVDAGRLAAAYVSDA
ncbi:MAG: serine hydrolase domain-containing protein, partial [Microvirgula sp.]